MSVTLVWFGLLPRHRGRIAREVTEVRGNWHRGRGGVLVTFVWFASTSAGLVLRVPLERSELLAPGEIYFEEIISYGNTGLDFVTL